MTATGYNPLLVFLFSCTLIISAAVLCNGESVLDTNGSEISVDSILGVTYRIENAAQIDFHGGLAMSPVPGTICENYIYEASETVPVFFDFDFTKPSVMEVGSRYRFTFHKPYTKLCKKPGQWTIADVVVDEHQTSFPRIIAGQEPWSNLEDSWFEVRSTEQKGVYKLAACTCQLCKMICPEIGAFTTDDGRTVLGIGGENYTVRFSTTVLDIKNKAEE